MVVGQIDEVDQPSLLVKARVQGHNGGLIPGSHRRQKRRPTHPMRGQLFSSQLYSFVSTELLLFGLPNHSSSSPRRLLAGPIRKYGTSFSAQGGHHRSNGDHAGHIEREME